MAAATLLSLALSLPSAALANDPDPDAQPAPWYEVELYIFAQADDNLMAEFWDERITAPPPPENALLLLQPDEDPNQSARFLPANPAAETSALAASAATIAPPQPAAPLSGDLASSAAVSAPRVVDTTLYQNDAYRRLGETQWQLPVTAQRWINRGYQPLFHAAWRQPVSERGQSLPIIVSSEVLASDGTPALSGVIELSISRYLHLDADLYYRIQTPPGWISMRPKGPDELEQPQTSSSAASLSSSEILAISPQTSEPTPSTLQLVMPEPGILTLRLQQSRRMRSGELHYIDHPMLGLIARVTPYELPQPEPEPLLPTPRETASDAATTQPARSAVAAEKDEKN
nr:CsiV family protein [Motiliproteus sediminis]